MRIGFFSDTHGLHDRLKNIEKCDVLVFCGDLMTSGYSRYEAKAFLTWFSQQKSDHKIVVAGNHDRIFESDNIGMTQQIRQEFPNLTYLENSQVVINGIKFYGSPITPTFYNWAFMANRGEKIKKYWDQIPLDTDVLITHGPPHKILDRAINGFECGCEELRKKVLEIRPKIHAFGHIHEGRGTHQFMDIDTLFVNCTVVDERYRVVYEPYYLNI